MKRLHQVFLALLMALLLAGCGLPGAQNKHDVSYSADGQDSFSQDLLPLQTEPDGNTIRAVWVSYLDLTSVLSPDEATYLGNLEAMLDNLESIAVTDIYWQVRAFGDSLSPSAVYPSAGVTTYSLAQNIDYLALAVERAHARGIRLHAWVNPYRLYAGENEGYNAFLVSLREQDTACVVEFDGGRFLNPASETARQLVLDGAAELLSGYDIDGIHLDDYFYPTTDSSFDADYYAAYKADGGGAQLGDWRRQQVATLIQALYKLVKRQGADIQFGISPDASIERDVNRHYLDVELICQTEGYLDYICPQVYFGYENDSLPFLQTISDWAALTTACDLVIGLGFYKVGTEDAYAGRGVTEWQQAFDIISRQYADCLAVPSCKGIALYRYDSMFNPTSEAASYADLELYNLTKKV